MMQVMQNYLIATDAKEDVIWKVLMSMLNIEGEIKGRLFTDIQQLQKGLNQIAARYHVK